MTLSDCMLLRSPNLQNLLLLAIGANELTPQTETRRSSLTIAEFNHTHLPREYLDGKLAAVLSCHCSLECLYQGRVRASIVLELFRTVVDLDVRTFACVLVISAFIGVLKSAPAADVINENDLKSGSSRFHFVQEITKSLPASQGQAAFAVVDKPLYDHQVLSDRILFNGV